MVNLNHKLTYESATLYFPSEYTDERWFGKKKEFDGRYLNLKAKVGEEETFVNAEISYPIIKQVLRLIEKDTLEKKLLKPIREKLLDDVSSAEKQILEIRELSESKEDKIHQNQIDWRQEEQSYFGRYKVYDNFFGRDYNGRTTIGKIVDFKARKIFDSNPDYLRKVADSNIFEQIKLIDSGIEEEGCGRGYRRTEKGSAYVAGSDLKSALENYMLCYKIIKNKSL